MKIYLEMLYYEERIGGIYIYDTESKPKDSDIDTLKQWRKSNAKIMS